MSLLKNYGAKLHLARDTKHSKAHQLVPKGSHRINYTLSDSGDRRSSRRSTRRQSRHLAGSIMSQGAIMSKLFAALSSGESLATAKAAMFRRKFCIQSRGATTLLKPLNQLRSHRHHRATNKGEQETVLLPFSSRKWCIQVRESSTDSGHEDRQDYSAILLTKNIVDHVAHLELNKPKSKNAFGFDSARELANALSLIEDDPSCRCLVLSGNGPNLTSGADLKSFMTVYAQIQELQDPAHRAKLLRKTIERYQAPFKVMREFGKPIIGVAHGLCYGLGMELSACCDIRYCSQDTKFSIREILIGIAADVGSLQLLPKLMSNQSLLRELIYTGRDLSLDEVRELGFVSKIFPTKQEALANALQTAQLIASRSPVAIQGSKRNLTFSEDKSFATGLDYNAIWNMAMMQSSDVEKAIVAILSRQEEVDYENF